MIKANHTALRKETRMVAYEWVKTKTISEEVVITSSSVIQTTTTLITIFKMNYEKRDNWKSHDKERS